MDHENKDQVSEEQVTVQAEKLQEVVNEIKHEAEELHQAAEEIKEATEKEAESYKEKYFYLAAEMENMRKRFEREKEQTIKYGSEKILKNLIEVVDNFERTLDSVKNDEDEKVKNIAVGIDMVYKQFLKTLEQSGVTQLSSLGQIFDPNIHEALSQMPKEGSKEEEIVQVYQEGYLINGRLLRPAKVVIVKND